MWTQDLPDLWTNTASFSAQNTSCICFLLKDNLILVVNGVSWPCSIYNVSVGPWLMTCHVFVWDWTRSQVSHCPRECYHAIVTSTSFCLSVSNMTWGTCGEGLHSWHSTEWISLSPLDMNKLILNSNNGFWHFFLLTLSVVSSGIFAYIHQSCEVVIVSPIRLYSTYLVIK